MKIPYEIIAIQVEKIFKSTEELTNPVEIENNFNKIRDFVTACGWSMDDYTDYSMGWINSLN